MIHQELKTKKKYTVPGKYITWILGNHTLDLEVKLDWVKYERGGLILPPVEFGNCNDWHFELSEDTMTGTFVASWFIRRVKNKLKLINNINRKIKPFALKNDD